MPTFVLISYDLKQNADTETRQKFDYTLESFGWKDCSNVASAKTKFFSGEVADSKTQAVTQIANAVLASGVKEIAYVIQCGNTEPEQKRFLHPEHNVLGRG